MSSHHRPRLKLIWGRNDYDALRSQLDRDWDRHVAGAIEQSQPVAELPPPPPEEDRGPCPVIDLFTRQRVR